MGRRCAKIRLERRRRWQHLSGRTIEQNEAEWLAQYPSQRRMPGHLATCPAAHRHSANSCHQDAALFPLAAQPGDVGASLSEPLAQGCGLRDEASVGSRRQCRDALGMLLAARQRLT